MNFPKMSPDDPKLTAYALGELEGDERAALEAALRDDPVARAAVDEIRATAAQLAAALGAEARDEIKGDSGVNGHCTTTLGAAAMVSGSDPTKLDGGPFWSPPKPRGRLLRFPQIYYLIGGLAAACLAVIVATRPRPPAAPAEKKYYRVIQLQPLVTPAAEAADTVAETRAKIELPSVAASEPTDAAASTAVQAPSTKTFLDQNLSLLAQAQQTERTAALGGAAAMTFSASNHLGATPAASPQPRAESPRQLARAGTAASSSAADADSLQLSAFTVQTPTKPTFGQRVRSFFKGRDKLSAGNETVAIAKTGAPYFAPGESLGLPMAPPTPRERGNTESYAFQRDNDFLGATENPFSTFSIDVDTASYANVRRFIASGRLPPPDAVRIEELVNYFPYHYAAPAPTDTAPFAASLEVAEAPWAPVHRLVRIGLKGHEVAAEARPPANLVFLLDVSGSMDEPNKLPLVKEAMRMLVRKLRPDDRVAIVTYAGASGLALPSTPAAQSREILDALDALTPGGSTNGAMGIQLAYDIAKANLAKDTVNRVILCTDGDFNVGVTSEGELVRLIQEKAKSGVFLTVLGFGMGNFKDAMLEKLADAGNGNYGYIDTRAEAEKLLVNQLSGTLVTIAQDVKIQVEFNPAKVASYRLIGYEDRLLKKEDFNNDKVDAGEIGAGHTVTALYEIVPAGAETNSADATPAVDERRYRKPEAGDRKDSPRSAIRDPKFAELLTVKIRYKDPGADVSRKLEFPLADSGGKFAAASADFKFAAAVAEFGMILRQSPHQGTGAIGDVIAWAAEGARHSSDDPGGYRSDFLDLARRAQALLR